MVGLAFEKNISKSNKLQLVGLLTYISSPTNIANMNRISQIRAKLAVTQKTLASALGVSQGNVSHYEKGQTIPPEVAKRLIAFANSLGVLVTFEDVYGPPEKITPLEATLTS